MRLTEIEIDSGTKRLIDVLEVPNNCVVVIGDGKAKIRELPEHGEYKIIMHQGKVKRLKKEEGEEF
ncbi:XtrA/YqaO family protein [Bacillus sp. REN10]|uniref:XtrA/YqaO family protein n=1 Tax=Bacillus sp. REN10 TaxID=2782541 RepID=UPI00193C6E72